ncbi:MAG: TlpA family protein disulfide reductase [Azoarcus sp.]|jgi:thiol-disulfide isomerase/thioredoxin|nr:TlpA family protein disulfide reductase [Azoarcus sp.]
MKIAQKIVLVGALFLSFFSAGATAGQDAEILFSATLTNLEGKPMPLAPFRDKPLIINFWARWCVPCRDEFPELIALRAKYAKQGLTVLGIALEDDSAKVREFLAAYKIDYPVALAREQGLDLIRATGNAEALLPYTLIINRQGEIVLNKYGRFSQSDFEAVARRLWR